MNEEILMAYHTEYWNRWAPRPRKRARDSEAGTSSANSAAAADADDAAEGVMVAAPATAESPAWDMGDDGRGFGRRVRGDASGARRPAGGKRGRPPKPMDADNSSNGTKRRKSGPRKLLWTDTGRGEYCRVLARTGSDDREGVSGRRFERGEGGGVT